MHFDEQNKSTVLQISIMTGGNDAFLISLLAYSASSPGHNGPLSP